MTAHCRGQVVLGNTFHLWLRPGLDVIGAHGGLRRFMGWDGPILTDSAASSVQPRRNAQITEGGRQIPLAGQRNACFLSPRNRCASSAYSSPISPWSSTRVTPYSGDRSQAAESMQLSLRWAERSRRAHEGTATPFSVLFRGACTRTSRHVARGPDGHRLDGYAIGGCRWVNRKEDMQRTLRHTAPSCLPGHRAI